LFRGGVSKMPDNNETKIIKWWDDLKDNAGTFYKKYTGIVF
jgi:hypothetical protein